MNIENNSLVSESGNSSNTSTTSNASGQSCLRYQNINSAASFLRCYAYFFTASSTVFVLELVLVLGIVLLNLSVCLLLSRKNAPKTTFDKILIGHAVVNGVTGLVDVPIFHVYQSFSYWPFGKVACICWSTFDNNVNTITNMVMLYMTWTRYRCIKAPKSYRSERLIRQPALSMVLICVASYAVWTPISVAYFLVNYQEGACSVSFTPVVVQVVINGIMWFTPLICIGVCTVYIVLLLDAIKSRRVTMMRTNTKMSFHSVNANRNYVTRATSGLTRAKSGAPSSLSDALTMLRQPSMLLRALCAGKLSPQTKFLMIISLYWIQWMVPCVIVLFNTICMCMPEHVISLIYWLTYTVTLTDPIIILLLNPNLVRAPK